MIEFRIQNAEFQHLDAISSLFRNNLESKIFPIWPDQKIEKCIIDSNTLVSIALNDSNSVCGFCLCRANNSEASIELLAVERAFRKKGVGSILLYKAEKFAYDKGFSHLSILVLSKNNIALRFYLNHDYKVMQSLPRYYAGLYTALRLQKNLSG